MGQLFHEIRDGGCLAGAGCADENYWDGNSDANVKPICDKARFLGGYHYIAQGYVRGDMNVLRFGPRPPRLDAIESIVHE